MLNDQHLTVWQRSTVDDALGNTSRAPRVLGYFLGRRPDSFIRSQTQTAQAGNSSRPGPAASAQGLPQV